MSTDSDEITLTVLRKADSLENQRQLADELGISIGKTNYILRALVKKGLMKMEHFVHKENKHKYRYLLTPKGIQEKLRLTERFIRQKKSEYEELLNEIEIMNHFGKG
jgi:EPS-associated MarR family transcriptional regulator